MTTWRAQTAVCGRCCCSAWLVTRQTLALFCSATPRLLNLSPVFCLPVSFMPPVSSLPALHSFWVDDAHERTWAGWVVRMGGTGQAGGQQNDRAVAGVATAPALVSNDVAVSITMYAPGACSLSHYRREWCWRHFARHDGILFIALPTSLSRIHGQPPLPIVLLH